MNSKDRMRLAIAANVSLQTVLNWDKGRPVTPANDQLLLRTASDLGLRREVETDPKES